MAELIIVRNAEPKCDDVDIGQGRRNHRRGNEPL
jgi:hypothetical protein